MDDAAPLTDEQHERVYAAWAAWERANAAADTTTESEAA